MKEPSETLTANRLKEAINDKNIAPIELSRLSGVAKSSISQYMSGRCSPTNLTATKMGKILDVSPMWLMGFDAPKSKELFDKQMSDPVDMALLTFYFNKLSESDKRIIMNLAMRLALENKEN